MVSPSESEDKVLEGGEGKDGDVPDVHSGYVDIRVIFYEAGGGDALMEFLFVFFL